MEKNIQNLTNINKIDIVSMWNNIAYERYSQIKNGEDDSFSNVLVPNIISLLSPKAYDYLLDLGCGNGILTKKLDAYAENIVGIDLAEKNIEIAQSNNIFPNINFFVADAENVSFNYKFDCVISNMVLMDAMNIELIIKNVSVLLNNSGDFIFSITHPCYWPIYWDYYKEDWFDYNKEIIIKNNFRIGKKRTVYKTVHFHRPLEFYVKILKENHFIIEDLKELKGKNFNFPRFLLIKAKKEVIYE